VRQRQLDAGVASTTVTGRLSARPQAQRTTLSPGAYQLGRDAGRDDGIIYVPHGVDPTRPCPSP